jgi:hypothetical protein
VIDCSELPSCIEHCTVGTCRFKCAFEVVDELLCTRGALAGDEMDLLLEFRSLVRARENADQTLRVFCELRRRLEPRHYLAFYRLRAWLANHLVAEVRMCPAAEPKFVPVRVTFYCFEAVRRSCLCAALGTGSALISPRVRLAFCAIVSTAQAGSRCSCAAPTGLPGSKSSRLITESSRGES